MGRVTDRQRLALLLLEKEGGCIGCYDERADEFSDDGEPDTWNALFDEGLAYQQYNTCLDTGTLNITPAGRTALRKENGDG